MNHSHESRSTSEVVEVSAGVRSVIDVISDVVCPWCFIGKRRLEKALALLERQDVTVRWKPFELNPDAPKQGMDRQAYRTRKFGSLAYAQQLETRVAAAGAEEGIEFRFDRITKIPNTFEAHRLIWFAGREQLQNTVAENLFRAYFIAAEDVGDTEVLKRIGAESGLDSGRLEELFTARIGTEELISEESEARTRGVSGVPTFFIDEELITSGASRPELLAAILGPALGPALSRCSPENGTCS